MNKYATFFLVSIAIQVCSPAISAENNLQQQSIKNTKLEGMTYAKARALILSVGWKPLAGHCLNNEYPSTCRNFPEIGNCSGTGLGYCDMTFYRKSKCLTVVTVGGPPERRHPTNTTVDGIRFANGPCSKDPNS